MASNQSPEDQPAQSLEGQQPRRNFLTVASGSALAGLLGGYGTFACMLGEFVYPAANKSRGWLFVCTVDHLAEGEALDFTAPTGAKVVVARQGAGTAGEDFLALSSVCPHLGCRVHWESQNDRFFCPCHNGAFDRDGKPVSGPPQSARSVTGPISHSRWRTDCCFSRFPWNRLPGVSLAKPSRLRHAKP
jgi:cytochrome b6-f complex iron-sulfur subunit